MRVLIIGCGLVGKELARRLKQNGHHVIGTTTTPSKVDSLREACSDVKVLLGSDRAAVHEAAQGCDAIAVCAGPAAQQAMTPEQRKATYHKILVETALSAATAPITGPVVALSSLSVYGDAANHLDVITEESPLTKSEDASPSCFQAAERTYMEHAKGRAAIFRCSDICGGEDPSIEEKIKMAHQFLGGSVPFHDDALFYRVHMLDVVGAMQYAIEHNTTGIFNLTHAELPPSNKQFFDAIGDAQGLPHLKYRNELLAPTKRVSTERLQKAGIKLTHTVAERMPEPGQPARSVTYKGEAPKPAIDIRGRELAVRTLDRIVKELGLKEELGADKGPVLKLIARGGPLEGKDVGSFRVFRGGAVHKLVYSAMTIEDFGMDTHQIYAFTAPGDARPHFTLDLAISPNTHGTFHIGLDLLPRVDLGASLATMQSIYEPLSSVLAETMKERGVAPATSIGPLMRALRSPWMLAAYVDADRIATCEPAIDAYLNSWLKLCAEGVDAKSKADAAWQDLAKRDEQNRAALFDPETNRVWVLLERLVGVDTVAKMREVLKGA